MSERLDRNDFHHNFTTIEKSKYFHGPTQTAYTIFHHRMERAIQPMKRQHSNGIAHGNANANYHEVVRVRPAYYYSCFSVDNVSVFFLWMISFSLFITLAQLPYWCHRQRYIPWIQHIIVRCSRWLSNRSERVQRSDRWSDTPLSVVHHRRRVWRRIQKVTDSKHLYAIRQHVGKLLARVYHRTMVDEYSFPFVIYEQ